MTRPSACRAACRRAWEAILARMSWIRPVRNGQVVRPAWSLQSRPSRVDLEPSSCRPGPAGRHPTRCRPSCRPGLHLPSQLQTGPLSESVTWACREAGPGPGRQISESAEISPAVAAATVPSCGRTATTPVTREGRPRRLLSESASLTVSFAFCPSQLRLLSESASHLSESASPCAAAACGGVSSWRRTR
jgi:hypothetical protein